VTFTSVDFPAPFAPTTETISAASTSKETPSSTRARPYCAETDLTLSNHHLLAEIGLDPRRVLGGRMRDAFEYLLAVMQHDYRVRQGHDGLHHVLDHHQRRAVGANLPDQRDQFFDFGWCEPGHNLVEQQQLRFGR